MATEELSDWRQYCGRLIKSGFENTNGVLQKVGRQKVSVLLESIGLIVEISKMNVEKA